MFQYDVILYEMMYVLSYVKIWNMPTVPYLTLVLMHVSDVGAKRRKAQKKKSTPQTYGTGTGLWSNEILPFQPPFYVQYYTGFLLFCCKDNYNKFCSNNFPDIPSSWI